MFEEFDPKKTTLFEVCGLQLPSVPPPHHSIYCGEQRMEEKKKEKKKSKKETEKKRESCVSWRVGGDCFIERRRF